MQKFWLMNQHDAEGPTALVETDGKMRVARILAFGPGITELKDQQAIQERVIGKVAPTLKPLVKGTSITVESVEPHKDLSSGSSSSSGNSNRADRRNTKGPGGGGGRVAGGPSRSGSQGDR